MSKQERRSDFDLRLIAAEASTLWERLQTPHQWQSDSPQSPRLAEIRLQRWRERAARNDEELFVRRLSWLQTTPTEALKLLGNAQLQDELPSWISVFAQALRFAETAEDLATQSRQPFAAILSPFVKSALEELAPACFEVFSQAILQVLAEDLLRELSHIAAPTLYLKFSIFRSQNFQATTEAAKIEQAEATKFTANEKASSKAYEAFSAAMLKGELWNFFKEFPALARLLSVTVELWGRNVSELAEALQNDLPKLCKQFGDDHRPFGQLVAVKPSLSDRHDGGRTVSLLEFASGLRLIFKPRDIGVETAWFSLLEFLNERGGDFRVLKTLNCQKHGWVEAVRHAPCADEVEARQFYFRAGQLLCILYLLEAYDCFCENILACGDFPVLIDMETLMHPALNRVAHFAPAEEAAEDILSDSVFRVGFLPSWEVGANGACFDMSGLGAKPGQLTPYLQRLWRQVNTDEMTLEQEPVRVEFQEHLPHLHGEPLTAAEYAEEIVAGFQHLYELLLQHRQEMTIGDGVLGNLGRQEVRVVFHATRIYSLLLKRLYAPKSMRSGVERSFEIDFFSRLYLESPTKLPLRAILECEIKALENHNIPRFTVLANCRSLTLPTGEILPDAFEKPAIERVLQRLASLHSADMELQKSFIRASLHLSATSIKHDALQADRTEDWRVGKVRTLSVAEFADEAFAIAKAIENQAIYSANGDATWIAPQLLPQANRQALRPLRSDLYDGLAGIALFFAALERTANQGRRTAFAALSPIRKFLAAADARRMVREGYTLGAGRGAGSWLYVLSRCSEFLEEPQLLQEALATAEKITQEWMTADEAFDVMDGAAGFILGLLALHKATGNATVLQQAVFCGEHLLKHQEAAEQGAAWRTGRGKFMTGFSHGAAGIALALLRLYENSGQRRFKDAAEAAIAFEDATFDEAQNNWPDFRQAAASPPAFMNAWCHGASGIALARAASIKVLDSPLIRRDVKAGICAVSQSSVGENDGICCGNLGRAEIFLAAAALSKDAQEQQQMKSCAVHLASVVVERARQSGGYKFSGQQDFFDPSFFQGLSGIGYQLLRIAQPQRLPCVLTWE
jgi:type 2 lantibiotic biosynthesis protein LanM